MKLLEHDPAYYPISNRIVARFVGCLLLAVVCSSVALASRSAQIQIGTVRVNVTDPSADVVVGAVVTLSNKITGYKQSATTDERGVAGFNNVPFDDYDVVIEALRFQQATRRITVRSNLPVELDVKLAVPGTRETPLDIRASLAAFALTFR